MPSVRLKGLNSRRKRLADGRVVTYWWAWKGGPPLPDLPRDDPAFLAAFAAAHERRKAPAGRTLATLTGLYKASPEWAGLAASTRRQWVRWLDRIAETAGEAAIGALPWKALDDRRVRSELLAWRDQFAAHPRQADYAMQVLSAMLGWALNRGLIDANAALKAGQLYAADRADLIWTPAELAAYRAAAPSPEVGFIVPLACLTALRREDLASLAWGHVGDVAIVKPALKTRRRGGAPQKTTVIPLLAETRLLLAEIRAQQLTRHGALCARAAKKNRPAPPMPLTVLSNTRGRPWSVNGLEHQVVDAKAAAGVDKHLHDARGTFGTRLRLAGLKASQIADVLAWEEKRVERLLATYVDHETIVRGLAAQIERSERGEP